MNLYIMSRGRAGKVNTLNWISKEWREQTYLVVGHNEVNEYRIFNPSTYIIGAPESVTNYSQKFQWILDGLPNTPEDETFSVNVTYGETETKAVILDDDLVFSQFVEGKLLTIRDPGQLDYLWTYMDSLLSRYALVGVHPRQHAKNPWENGELGGFEENGRIICIQGINREKIGKVKVDQFPILADVVLNCTLLSRGQANAIIATHFQDHGPCQAPGGCSLYRTPAMQRSAVEYLSSRWPGFVKVVERKPKVAKWMGDTRYDYTCQWKRLYAAGVAHVLDPGKRTNPDKERAGATETMDS